MNEYRKSHFADGMETVKEDFLDDFLEDEGYYSFDDYVNNIGDELCYNGFYNEFKTSSGETVVAFGHYGSNY